MKNLIMKSHLLDAFERGEKDVTRRLVNLRKVTHDVTDIRWIPAEHASGWFSASAMDADGIGSITRIRCPYREGEIVFVGEALKSDVLGWAIYKRDGAEVFTDQDSLRWRWKANTLPGRYCPESCARTFARILSVRAERLQEITDAEVMREGLRLMSDGYSVSPFADGRVGTGPKAAFAYLWDEINGKRAPWSANPWVFRIALQRLTREQAMAEAA